ncbi:hypothetical protein FOZ70_34755 [Burkholderia sp. COPS]|uniref:hypothetical protein n=1 Tax=Burkholderia sp. COPS TaxID=2597663 RepID=UPI001CA51591|nr:hypothetical protein [Burkholderia sp. COPS]
MTDLRQLRPKISIESGGLKEVGCFRVPDTLSGLICAACRPLPVGVIVFDCPLERDSESFFDGLMIRGETVDCIRASPEPIGSALGTAQPDGFFGGEPSGLLSDRARSDSAPLGTGCIKPSIQG